MFFSISKTDDLSFPFQTKLGDYTVSHDAGWMFKKDILYKGISNTGIFHIESPDDVYSLSSSGNFCVIYVDGDSIKISTGGKQKFPIFLDRDKRSISNLYQTEEMLTTPISISESILGAENSEMPFTKIHRSDDDLIDKIDQTLEESIRSFNSQTPLKLYITGVDTLIIASYVLKHRIPYELVPGEHVEMDHFLCHHRPRIRKNFWAYQTVQHWKEPSILLTGGHGDETMLRDAVQAFVYFSFYGEDLLSICKEKNHYHSLHFLKEENLLEYENLKNKNFNTEDEMKQWLINLFKQDYQHWHLGETLFFSPFDNLDLLNYSLNLSYETAKKQLLDAYVSKEIISRNRPGLLKLLSKFKNHDYYKNLDVIYSGKKKLEDL